jgi:predicted amidophosphoribosyltransferase
LWRSRDERVWRRHISPGSVGRVLLRLLALVVPPACLACRVPLMRPGDDLCLGCRAALPWLPRRTCARCGLPPPCGSPCPARAAAFTRSWAPLAHDGPARALVRALKFHRTLAAADVMAAHVAANAPPALLCGATLVPVPAPRDRRRARGFDHADLLARALARRTGAPVDACLRREGDGAARQLGASAARRRARGRLEVRCPAPAPAVALLVDDVHTTGATLDACARALREAGARRVAAVTYTRALP